MINFYDGFKLDQENYELEKVQYSNISSVDFFIRYVSRRKPCLISGPFKDSPWNIEKWSNSYLREKAGNATIKVEFRSEIEQKYGQGNEKVMTFGEFLDEIDRGNKNLYLTTQDLRISEEGLSDIISPPIVNLLADIPIKPKIMGNLIPQNINLWSGFSGKEGSSSGLHHDFHDNLYILLRGIKKFYLWSPDSAEHMYTYGNIISIHPNGRINYEGQVTRADGSDVDAEKALEKETEIDKRVLEFEIAEKEIRGELEESDRQARLSAAEEAIEKALESALDVEYGTCSESDCSTTCSVENVACLYNKKRSDSYDGKRKINSIDCYINKKAKMVPKYPDNFSKVDRGLKRDEILSLFPNFFDTKHCEVEIKAGDFLFLPAGWFHEVFSCNDAGCSNDKPGHMALNYWFHPPDSNSTYDNPYHSEFWHKDWMKRLAYKNMEGFYSNN